ncbi:MAG: efflux RND transporter periplasmic adaptor subunit [Planctomycetes bacterium]|nr:efflux RND transporter periplasmic adaptor subunit [Planctomycetota bacterium]
MAKRLDAQVEALQVELGLRRLDLRIKALEVEQSVLQSQARLDFARRANDRVSQLREKGVGTEQQSDEAERNLLLAQAERDTALTMKQSYDALREELSRLTANTTGGSENDSRAASPLRMPIKAPISGVIVHADPVEGEHVEEHEEVFRIIDADPLRVTAKVSEFDLSRLPKAPGAILTFSADSEKKIDILEEGGRLIHIGSVVDPESRTVPIHYELPNPDGLFRVGQFVEVRLETQTASEAVAIPEDAVVMDNGRPIAFVLIGGESFQRRELELGVRDGGFVEVRSGIAVGERVVTQGAYTVKLASLSPASFGHGHAH